jgi:hypothetical protein
MLYILPPPSAPSPPSPWNTILCGGSEGSASGGVGGIKGGTVKTVAGGTVAAAVQRNSWVTVTATSKRPPAAGGHVLKNHKTRVSY